MSKSEHHQPVEHGTRRLGKNLLLTLLLFSSFSAYAASITARILGLENAEGQVVVTMYSVGNKAIFPKNPGSADYLKTAGIREGEATLAIADVRPGVYAIFAFHDRNGNGSGETALQVAESTQSETQPDVDPANRGAGALCVSHAPSFGSTGLNRGLA